MLSMLLFQVMEYAKTFDFVTICVAILSIFGSCRASDNNVSDTVNTFALHHLHANRSENYLSAVDDTNNVKLLKTIANHNELQIDSCGGSYRARQVVIASPRYPNHYPKNVNCDYTFYSPFVCTTEFHVQFLDFVLEPSLNCSKDRVIIGSDEVLCGQVIGIMKYKVKSGVLRINFITDATIENKGFKLLVTRLPCTDSDLPTETIYGEYSTTTNVPIPSTNVIAGSSTKLESQNHLGYEDFLPDVEVKSNSRPNTNILRNNGFDIPPSSIPEEYPITPKPPCTDSTPSNNIWTNIESYPSPFVPIRPIHPSLPSCCANIFNQRRFFLISPRFPNPAAYFEDCLYFVERAQSNICRLRIEFKYFLLGDRQYNQCVNSFIEIDGRRFCGCRSGFVYHTPIGYSPKVIRFSNWPINRGTQGFILDIVQEECPYRSTVDSAAAILPTYSYQPKYLLNIIKPQRCYFDHTQWLRFAGNQNFLAQSICIQNRYK